MPARAFLLIYLLPLVFSLSAPGRYQDSVLARLRTNHLASIASDTAVSQNDVDLASSRERLVKDFRGILGGTDPEKHLELGRIEKGFLDASIAPDREDVEGRPDVALPAAEEVGLESEFRDADASQERMSRLMHSLPAQAAGAYD